MRFKFSLLLLSILATSALAQPIPNCIELGNMVEYLAKMKNEGLSKSEIQQNIREIARIKNLTSTQLEDWFNNLNWLFKPENKSLNLEGLSKKKKQECETDRGIVNWNKD
jgi:hypothetical protein